MNRHPGDAWQAQAVHHGVRGLVVLVLGFALPAVFPGQPEPVEMRLEPGMVAPSDVIADFDLPVPKPSDQLARERADRERAALPIFRLDPSAPDSAIARVSRFLAELGTALETADRVEDDAVSRVLDEHGVPLGAAQLEYLRPAVNRRALEQALSRGFTELLPRGVVSAQSAGAFAGDRVIVRDATGDRVARGDSLTTIGEFAEAAFTYAPGSVQGFRAFQSILLALTIPSLRPDPVASQAERESARAAVDSTIGVILQGERIVTAHERVSQSDLTRLRAYNAELSRRRGSLVSRGAQLAGSTLFTALLLTLVGVVLLQFRPVVYREFRHFLIIVGLTSLIIGGAALAEHLALPAVLVPVVLVALALGAVYDGLVALVVVLISTLLLTGLASLVPLYDPLVIAAGGSVAALGVRGVRRRRQSWVLVAGIVAAYAVTGLAIALLAGASGRVLLETLLWGGLGATLYTVLALGGLVPLMEKVTGISTTQTLLELCDLNAPLLRELSLKAPGTYAHSINIANLAEAACEAIGADSLLVRAGSYYHDIGKMVNPQYFVENQPKGRNPHDRLPPVRSATIIRDHVRDGIRLADEHRLPPVIHDFIREHHGTALIRFFYDRALEQGDEGEVNPGDFVYLGPKPQTRETAIVMIADGIESASRLLRDPTPERIRSTIEAMVEARMSEGQLDQCPLTLRELDLARAAFARVLIGMYHRRIDYPSGVQAVEAAPPEIDAPATEP
ncbi:MAG: HDIG domain-containing protein [Gemmatimonadota bacterium]|nr:HDIG domain-containing protein [Gemmatimonadota bacterium]MDH3427774.1 HDIG domain-containing protein [Gemmatimonadota bacterium]